MKTLTPAQKIALDRVSTQDTCIIIDGHALIYRAYYAFPNLTDHTGRLVNAVYGFTRNILVAIRDFAPKYIAVCFDSKEKTHRAAEFEAYKANRPQMPDDLQPQIALVKEVVAALNIPQFAVPGFEADDLIGTIAAQLDELRSQAGAGDIDVPRTVIVTGDKDLLQLVTPDTHVWIPARGSKHPDVEYDSERVLAKLGVLPEQVVDLKALMGDASDNIPGVSGIGPKTASALITAFGSLDGVYQALDAIDAGGDLETEGKGVIKGSVITKLRADREQAYVSQKLARIDTQSPVEFSLPDCRVTEYDKSQATALLEEFDFKSLIQLLPQDTFELGVQSALF